MSAEPFVGAIVHYHKADDGDKPTAAIVTAVHHGSTEFSSSQFVSLTLFPPPGVITDNKRTRVPCEDSPFRSSLAEYWSWP
jgi:hypothetical protein